jgi:hypothetical protein
LKEMQTELMLLTDGDIWSQQQLFDYISEQTEAGDVRVFPIGIGGGVSSALIEGIARAGHGFGQLVARDEKLDSKIVRMVGIHSAREPQVLLRTRVLTKTAAQRCPHASHQGLSLGGEI